MGSSRVTLCAEAVVAAALTVSAPSVHAADSGNVSVVPASPAPGSDIQVRAQGCAGRSGTAASKAFVADAQLTRLSGGSLGTLAGETRVRSSLKPGTYGVRITCDGKEDKVKGTIEVGDGKPGSRPPATRPPATKPPATKPPATERSRTERPADESAASPPPQAPASPVAPVRAGGGGAAAQLAVGDTADARGSADPANSMDDARHTGPGTRHAVIGLVLAGVAGVVVVARGARRGHHRGTE
ncbi:hypothetical protein F9278_17180 [Streptomyces phaeolivaceus]|uniref:Serine/threonine protein kinase n=1 Tax=Streptomyces phaeolivaceus TaxID=2653200 RepID=A0A5P8K3T4_9ACTN|nr:hypothetical protein [Streptomyces phaeolivaceus]QFQ97670.1 hypothetical protein F9278_17180 [Streptomyces phaeolivaceus]